jgi:V8-like Glu-specific endopeptidase
MPEEDELRWFADRMPSNDVLAAVLEGDPVTRLMNIARDRAVVNIDLDPVAKPGTDEQAVKKSLRLAAKAAKKVAEGGTDVRLTNAEKEALELFILLIARPAIFVRNGKVPERPENWPEVKRDEELLPRVIAGVGRIEDAAHGGRGTGFIVGAKRILTNNHVLCSLFGMQLDFWRTSPQEFAEQCRRHNKTWTTQSKAQAPFFELRGEFGSDMSATVRISRILGHHTEVDMAVLELDQDPADGRQLLLMSDEPQTFNGRRIYAVGYPMGDPAKVTPIPVFNRVFGADKASLGKKRFSPGTVMEWGGENHFSHDASTLPGSSGSAIVDFEQRRVVGLHFSGQYRESNNAVPLWKFRQDPVLVDNGVEFG